MGMKARYSVTVTVEVIAQDPCDATKTVSDRIAAGTGNVVKITSSSAKETKP